MDTDGDGAVSLSEFQAAHERIFKAIDGPDQDGKITMEEMLAFMQGQRGQQRPAQ
jgi:Ca2+-binding EF-hand superfamily protein